MTSKVRSGGKRSAAWKLTEPAVGIFFVEGPASNWIIARRGQEFTLIDGGYRGDLPRVLASIRAVGLDPGGAVALLITHAHVDHTGAAAHFARRYGTPVFSSAAEHRQMTGVVKFQVSPLQILARAWRPRVLRWTVRALQSGGSKAVPVPSAEVWDDALLASLPGGPVAVPTPGHTPGHTAFYLPAARAVATGDALVTGHGISTRNGPQLLHPMFHHHRAGVQGSLAVLAKLDAGLLLPGHGPALRMPVRDAVEAVRRTSVTGSRASRSARPGLAPVPGRTGLAGNGVRFFT
ncbi:MBL fold metallo-hydrolase [Arthrobacter zhangbolii]|uniref:MBL fold metallo-hydrolase n=1 Tax=Arthrobacter zhangbolii TaxID=2886936 RepID=A0A9X1S949_9MICC|nr:MBL fold metallo-hydrolase [Arthrobacter zhangbolii]MCC3273325.1 MBL fold metallo-hydrolase [Arthrobacter zhangbolii]UON92694.1 MBL fold metallo-hydrolase [Arthrobacter zhangbolii]